MNKKELLKPKIQQTKMLVTCQNFGDLVFIWAGLAVFFSSDKYDKGRSKVIATYLRAKFL